MPLIKRATDLLAFSPEELEDKLITYDLTRILKGKGALLQLIVKKTKDSEELTSVPRQLKLLPYFLKRMVRKGSNYVEDSFSTECKDAQLKLKPFLITRRKVPRSVRKALRNLCKEELTKYVKDKTTEDVFDNILKGMLQKELSIKLKKIYPLSLCEIRRIKFENKLAEKKEEPSKEEVKEDKPKE